MNVIKLNSHLVFRINMYNRHNPYIAYNYLKGVTFSVLASSSKQDTALHCKSPFQQTVRWKALNKSKLKGTLGCRRSKIRGMKREDGEYVTAGTILVKQLGLLYFPGLNVGLARNRDLFAMEHGYVMITTEKVNPNWNQKIMHMFFGQYADRKDIPIFKTYFHIISEPMPQNFNLVSQI